jgi:FkbM family methyltransferase
LQTEGQRHLYLQQAMDKSMTYKRRKVGYTQSDEEVFILANLEGIECGSFLDIGAFDGISNSNTRALLERGWSGVYVEPCPVALAQLRTNTEPYRDRIRIIEAAVGDRDGEATFYTSNGDQIGSLNDATITRWPETEFAQIKVPCMTPETLLAMVGTKFDCISIDVEMTNERLFFAMPWEQLKPTMIIVEHDKAFRAMREHLFPDYRQVYINPENLILVRREL